MNQALTSVEIEKLFVDGRTDGRTDTWTGR